MNHTPAFEWLGHQPYESVWQRLKRHASAVAAAQKHEVIWACEHDPVYTTGKRAVDNRAEPTLPAPLIKTDRGGETTFHGPGQIMLYPVVHLRNRGLSPKQYVYMLEQSCIDLLDDLNIIAGRHCGLPGVWIDGCKIAALGLRISSGVAYHGMALNVHVEQKWFASINPCGTGKKSTSVAEHADTYPQISSIARQWSEHLKLLLGRN